MDDRRLLEAIAAMHTYVSHDIDKDRCAACLRWDELQSAAMGCVSTIERLQRERNEARAERDAFWDALAEVEAVLRNNFYKNRVTKSLAIIDETRHIDRDELRAALGDE